MEDESRFNQGSFYSGPEQAAKDAAALVRAFAKENLPKVESKDSRETLEAQLNRLGPSFERLKQLFEPWRLSNPEKFPVVWDELSTITTGFSVLGASAAWSPSEDAQRRITNLVLKLETIKRGSTGGRNRGIQKQKEAECPSLR